MKAKILSLFLFSWLFLNPACAIEVTEDENYIYTRKDWTEITADFQRMLIHFFNQKLSDIMSKHNIPTFWDEKGEHALIGSQSKFITITQETVAKTESFAVDHNISIYDLVPTGFIVGIGFGGSGSFGVGFGGSLLLTLAVAPYEVQRVDKITGETTSYYEATWSIGGIVQQDTGVGAGASVALKVAAGPIWGPLPQASDLQGFAVGASATISYWQGVGFKVALVFNSVTHEYNVVAMATYELGLQEGTGIYASGFYFLSADQIIKLFGEDKLQALNGFERIDFTHLKLPTTFTDK